MNLENKVAFITGGSRGIGAATCLRLAEAGARVAFTYQSSAEKAEALKRQLEQKSGAALALRADSADASQIAAAIAKVASTWGAIDIVVSNAGVFIPGAINEASLDDFSKTVAVNIQSVFVATKEAVKYMPDGGRIIAIGSNMADRVSTPGASLYSMSKSALIGLIKGFARDLGKRNITANIIQPGPVDTDMNPENGESAARQHEMLSMPRFGRPEEIASLVCYLAAQESSFITGTAITADGGTNA